MARPKMKFTPQEAVSIINSIAVRLLDSSWCDNHLVKEPGSTYLAATFDARKAFEPLVEMAQSTREVLTRTPTPFPDEGCTRLREWLTTWLTPEGWTRFLAARRQRSLKRKKSSVSSGRETAVDMPDMSAYYLLKMATRVGLDRKTYIEKLVSYLEYDEDGRKALEQFERSIRSAQKQEARDLLQQAFSCEAVQVGDALSQIQDREAALTAARALGKAKLVRLAAWAKKQSDKSPLLLALMPHTDFDGKSPLIALSLGAALPSSRKKTEQVAQP